MKCYLSSYVCTSDVNKKEIVPINHHHSPILRSLKESIQHIHINIIHILDLIKHLLNLKQRVRRTPQPQILAHRIGIAFALPAILATDRRFLLPVGQQVLQVVVAGLDACEFFGGRWGVGCVGWRGEGGEKGGGGESCKEGSTGGVERCWGGRLDWRGALNVAVGRGECCGGGEVGER